MRHGDSEANEFVFVVHHKGHKILVQNRNVLLHITVYLVLGKLRVLIQAGEGLVEHMKHLPTATCHFPDGIGPIDTDAKTVCDAVRELEHGRHLRGDVHHALGPVHILGETQPFQVLRIIGIVVNDRKGAFVLEALHQKAFPVHVREAKGTFDFFCAPFRAPGDNCVDERLAHIEIVNKIYPAKADGVFLPLLIGFLVDDGGHAAHGFSVLFCQEQFPFAEGQGGVFRAQGLIFIVLKGRNPLVAVFVQVQREFDKILEHALVRDGHNGCFRFHTRQLSYKDSYFSPTNIRQRPKVNDLCRTVLNPASTSMRMNSAGGGNACTEAGR